MMLRDRLSPRDRELIRQTVSGLTPEVLDYFRGLPVSLFGRIIGTMSDAEVDMFGTEEGLLLQVDKFSVPVGLIYFLTPEKKIDKMALALQPLGDFS